MLDAFETLLLRHGYVRIRDVVKPTQNSMADSARTVSFQHPRIGWAHVSSYCRGNSVRYECVIHPQLLGERMVFSTPEPADARIKDLLSRAKLHGTTDVCGEPRKK